MNASGSDIAGSVADLLAELNALGVQLATAGDRVRFRPWEAVTEALAKRMRAHKADLLAAVRRREALDSRIAREVAELVPCRGRDGRCGWTNPRYRRELEALGVL